MSDNEEEQEEVKYEIQYEGDEEPSPYYTKDGQASVTYANGDSYEGTLVNALKQGEGTYKWTNGGIYEGHWEESIRSGQGKFTYPDGSVYHGEWKDNQRHGQGTYIYSNGDSYCGQFVAGIREGHGIYTYKDSQAQLIGQWKDNDLVSGEWRFADSTKYFGDFNGNLPVGKGLFVFPNGNQVEGSYCNGDFFPKQIAFNPV